MRKDLNAWLSYIEEDKDYSKRAIILDIFDELAKEPPKFQFGNVVVVENNLIGVIVKTWGASFKKGGRGIHYEVYVRTYNAICEYDECDISHFVYDKEIGE